MFNTHSPTHDIPVIPKRYARCLFRFMEHRGISRLALMEGTGIQPSEITENDGQLSIRTTLDILSRAEALLDDEASPFQLGQSFKLADHDLLGFSALHQQDNACLTSLLIQYLRIRLPLLDMEVNYKAGNFTILLKDRWGLGHLHHFVTKLYMGCLYSLGGVTCENFTVSFDFPKRLGKSAWDALAQQARVDFDAPHCQISMSVSRHPAIINMDDSNDLPASPPNDTRLGNWPTNNVLETVRQHITRNPGRNCTLEKISEQMNMSPRSLRRHLRLAGFTFHGLRNDIRKTFATRYLKDSNIPIERIAEKLGYSDQSSFTKAYTSWTGQTPGRVRNKKPQALMLKQQAQRFHLIA